MFKTERAIIYTSKPASSNQLARKKIILIKLSKQRKFEQFQDEHIVNRFEKLLGFVKRIGSQKIEAFLSKVFKLQL